MAIETDFKVGDTIKTAKVLTATNSPYSKPFVGISSIAFANRAPDIQGEITAVYNDCSDVMHQTDGAPIHTRYLNEELATFSPS